MNNYVFSYFKVISLVCFINLIPACSKQNYSYPTKDIIQQNIEYWVEIDGENPLPSYLKSTTKDNLIEWILSEVQKQNAKVFYYLNDTLIPYEDKDLSYLFFHIDTVEIETEVGFKNTAIEHHLSTELIHRLKFRETWYLAPENQKIYKKIHAICPMIQRFNDDGSTKGYAGLFWLYLD